MNSEQVNQIIDGIGLMTEIWVVAYQNFLKQGLSTGEAIASTKELLSLMMDSIIGGKTEDTK